MQDQLVLGTSCRLLGRPASSLFWGFLCAAPGLQAGGILNSAFRAASGLHAGGNLMLMFSRYRLSVLISLQAFLMVGGPVKTILEVIGLFGACKPST